MKFQDIIYTKEDGIATITLNRPQSMNAIGDDDRMSDEWVAAIEDARNDVDVKVLVVTGAGRAFCAGANPRILVAEREKGKAAPREPTPAEESLRWREITQAITYAMARLDKPYIGSINGPAIGGGMDLASMCDIRIASDRARFGMGFVRMGVTPSNGGCYWLPRIVGIARACELIWTGRIIDAQEALAIGYVSKVVPHDELEAATKEFASQLARGPSVAIRLDKRLIYRCLELDMDAALEAHEWAMVVVNGTEDAKEGPKAWVEKREPVFKGR